MYSIPSTGPPWPGSWRPYALRLSTDWFDWTEKYIFSIFLPVLPLTSLYTIVSQSLNLVIRTSPLGVSHRRLCDILKDIKKQRQETDIALRESPQMICTNSGSHGIFQSHILLWMVTFCHIPSKCPDSGISFRQDNLADPERGK